MLTPAELGVARSVFDFCEERIKRQYPTSDALRAAQDDHGASALPAGLVGVDPMELLDQCLETRAGVYAESEAQPARDDDDFHHVRGDEIVKNIEALLTYFGPSRMQRMLLRAAVNAILPILYGDDWDHVRRRVLRERGIDDVMPFINLTVSRRFGKTTAIAMLVVAILYYADGIRVGVFSTGQRATSQLLKKVGSLWNRLPAYTNAAQRIINRTNIDKFYTSGFYTKDEINYVDFFPLNETVVRAGGPRRSRPKRRGWAGRRLAPGARGPHVFTSLARARRHSRTATVRKNHIHRRVRPVLLDALLATPCCGTHAEGTHRRLCCQAYGH